MGKMDSTFKAMKVENTAGFDLNLLRALAVLIEESSVTHAADRLGVSQPAMSRTLGRLRDSLGDALLVRTGRGMRLTTRAEAMRAPLQRLMGDVQALVLTEPLFEPAHADTEFVLSADPSAQCTLVPDILSAMATQAPGIKMKVQSLACTVEAALLGGEADLVIGPSTNNDSDDLHRRRLLKDTFVCLIRRQHPRIDRFGKLTDMDACGRIRIANAGWWGGMVETALHEGGQSGRVRIVLPDLLSAPFLISETDLVLVVPKSIGERLSKLADLSVVDVPCAMPSYHLAAFWHGDSQPDPAHRWFRRLIAETAGGTGPQRTSKG